MLGIEPETLELLVFLVVYGPIACVAIFGREPEPWPADQIKQQENYEGCTF
jgi:hypothetical protein